MDIGQLIAGRDPDAIITCDVGARLSEAVDCLAARRIGAMPVMRGGAVAGIISERDIIYRLRDEGAVCLERSVSEVMTAPAITVEHATNVDEALSLMTRRRIRHLPVVEGDRMLGFVSIGDLVKWQVDKVTAEAEQMRQYIRTA